MSTGFLLVLLYMLFGTLSDRAASLPREAASKFGTLRLLIVVIWLVYPVWWLLGTEGLGVVPLYVETLGFAVLDVTAKVGFGFILLSSRKVLESATAPDSEAA